MSGPLYHPRCPLAAKPWLSLTGLYGPSHAHLFWGGLGEDRDNPVLPRVDRGPDLAFCSI